MFGPKMSVSYKEISIELVPLKKIFLPEVTEGLSSYPVIAHTGMRFAPTLVSEEPWYERTCKDRDTVSWVIVPQGHVKPIGITSLHEINSFDGSCTSGIIIWDQSWWGQGVATASHYARTLFATYQNRSIIRSKVHSTNIASRRALEKMGYACQCRELFSCYEATGYVATDHMLWLHPDRRDLFFGRNDVIPREIESGMVRAKTALEVARKIVTFP